MHGSNSSPAPQCRRAACAGKSSAASAWDAITMLTRANVEESLIARMMGENAAQQFGIALVQTVGV